MAFGFDLEEVIGLEEEREIIKKKKPGKFAHIYREVQELIDAESQSWLKIGKLIDYTTAACIKKGIKSHFSNIALDLKIRKYDISGRVNFSVYVRYLFG